MPDPFAPTRVDDVDAAHHEAIEVDAMRTRVLQLGGGLMRGSTDRYGARSDLASAMVHTWTERQRRSFAHWMVGYGAAAVITFHETRIEHAEGAHEL